QARVGWISEGGLNYVSQRLMVPPAEAYGVAAFYAMFSTTPRPRTGDDLRDDIACRVNGAEALCEEVDRADLGQDTTWVRSPCLGLCEQGRAALIQRAGGGGLATVHGTRSSAPASLRMIKLDRQNDPLPRAMVDPAPQARGR